ARREALLPLASVGDRESRPDPGDSTGVSRRARHPAHDWRQGASRPVSSRAARENARASGLSRKGNNGIFESLRSFTDYGRGRTRMIVPRVTMSTARVTFGRGASGAHRALGVTVTDDVAAPRFTENWIGFPASASRIRRHAC